MRRLGVMVQSAEHALEILITAKKNDAAMQMIEIMISGLCQNCLFFFFFALGKTNSFESFYFLIL